MEIGNYVGVNNQPHKIIKNYVGINNQPHQVKKIYIGVGNQPRLCYSSSIGRNILILVTYDSIPGNFTSYSYSILDPVTFAIIKPLEYQFSSIETIISTSTKCFLMQWDNSCKEIDAYTGAVIRDRGTLNYGGMHRGSPNFLYLMRDKIVYKKDPSTFAVLSSFSVGSPYQYSMALGAMGDNYLGLTYSNTSDFRNGYFQRVENQVSSNGVLISSFGDYQNTLASTGLSQWSYVVVSSLRTEMYNQGKTHLFRYDKTSLARLSSVVKNLTNMALISVIY